MTPASGLTSRLETCVNAMGGKRALAAASGISESQLYRYMADESSIPAERLVAIAHAAKVNPGWLLTGEGLPAGEKDDKRPSFRSGLMVQIVQVFEELLLEYERTFTPRQRARAMSFMYEALRHSEELSGRLSNPEKFEIYKYVSFLSEMRSEEELETMLQAIDLLEYSPSNIDFEKHFQLLTSFCNLISRGYRKYYDSYAGQAYFERMGQQLDAPAVQYMHQIVAKAMRLCGKNELDWLDVGCGNGRHISHLHRHYPHVHVSGLELSAFGIEVCKTLIKSGKLPDGSVEMGDFRQMPYPESSYDVVFSRFALHGTPYLPNTGLGMEAAFEEIRRVLKPGGVAILVMLYGSSRDYLMPRQLVDERIIDEISNKYGYGIVETQREENIGGTKPCPLPLGQPNTSHFQVVLRKPA